MRAGEATQDVARAAQGDVQAFERLYRRHLASMHRLASWMLGRNEVDDVIQEVFVRAWLKLELFDGRSSFGTWLRKLAVHVIIRQRERLERLTLRHAPVSDVSDADGLLPRPGLQMDLEAGLKALPEGARQIFVLHDVEGFKHTEIAAMLSISASASRSQLHRARMLLRRFLE